MPVLSLKLLGQMECRLPSGSALNLTSQKSKLLLAYLALAPGIRYPRDVFKNLLWSDRSDEQAQNSLRQSLSSLKKAFAPELPGLFLIDRTTVGLNFDQVWVDALEFDRLLNEPTKENLSKAVSLYRHELLQDISIRDLPCQDWLATERDRLRRRALDALSDLIGQQLSESLYREAIESAERLVELDPLYESGWRQLMLAYDMNGNRNHALMAYNRCRDVLLSELAVEPDAETIDLVEQIKQRKAAGRHGSDRGATAGLNPVISESTGIPEAPDAQVIAAVAATSDADLPSMAVAPVSITQAQSKASFDYLMQGWYHAEKHNPEDTAIAIEYFQKCVEMDSANADAHAALAAELHVELFENWSTNRESTLELASRHLDLGLGCDPENALAHAYRAEHLLFWQDFDGAATHADRAMECDPGLPDSSSIKAAVLAARGRLDEAMEFADLSLRLDPHHPYSGWNAGEVYRAAGEYELAIKTFRRIHAIPPSVLAEIAACLAGLEKYEEARAEMRRYLEIARRQMPRFPAFEENWYALWRENHSTQTESDFDRLFDLLCKAGLCSEIRDSNARSGFRHIPSIAVLPFANLSGDSGQEYLADGITHDIIAALSRIKNMRIVARHSVMHYKGQKRSLSQISEQQNVRYVLVGSVGISGQKVRVNVELIDSQTDEICWVEQYESWLDDVFAVQDEISKNITVAMQARFSGGIRDRQRASGTQNVKAWQLCLAATDLQDSYIKANVLEARRISAQALELDPDYCYARVTLGWTYWQEIYCGWSEDPESSLERADRAAAAALAADPGNPEAWALAGLIHAMRHEPDLSVEACQKAVNLEPGNAEVQALLACAQCFAGQYDRAWISYETSLRLCPVCPSWYLMIGGIIDMFFGRYVEAIAKFHQGVEIEPDSPLCRYYLIDALIESGAEADAQRLAGEVRALDESFRATGIIRIHSHDRAERARFRNNLARVGIF